DPGPDWEPWSKEVAEGLVKKDLDTAKKWTLLLRGVRFIILRSVEKIVLDPGRPESERSLAAVLLMDILIGGVNIPTQRQLHSTLALEGTPYKTLSELFTTGGQEAAAVVQGELDKLLPDDTGTLDGLARRQAHAAVLLLQLEEWDSRRGPLDQSEPIRADRIWPLFRDSPDPRLHSLRSYLIHRFARVGV